MSEKKEEKQPKKQKEEVKQVDPLQEMQVKIDELTDLLKRNQAEFSNYQKRMEQQQVEQSKFAAQSIITKLIPIIDHFDMAIAHAKEDNEFVQGVKMIHTQLQQVLTEQGVEIVDIQDKPYDPTVAQCLQTLVDNEKEDNTVVQIIAKPYKLGGRIIRQGQVIVSKKEEAKK